jgi:hypothetical protein
MDFTLRQIERLQRNQPVLNRIVQTTIFPLALMSRSGMRLLRRMPNLVVMIAVFQDDRLQTNFATVAIHYFTGSMLMDATHLDAGNAIASSCIICTASLLSG